MKEDKREEAKLLESSSQGGLLRFSTAGSVDDGKSTLIGRLLHDSKNVYEDHLSSITQYALRYNDGAAPDLALLTDGLRAEREQGITIDVAYRYFSTPKRKFILADAPGHEQYTRNMATGASTAQLTIILIDATKGVLTQTRRHAFIASLLGVPRLLVAINKMDLVSWSERRFEEIVQEFTSFASKLDIHELRFIPVSALQGDNVVETSENMPWYHGESVLEHLENVYTSSDTNYIDFRFPVQYVLRPAQQPRLYAGQIASGSIRSGEEVIVVPSMRKTRIRSIHGQPDSEIIFAPMSVAISLEDEIDISRGDMIARANNIPEIRNHFEAMLVWMDETALDPKKSYLVMHTTRQTRGAVDKIGYKIDVNTLSRLPGAPLGLNEIGRVTITTTSPIFFDSYKRNRNTGNFILIDPDTFLTAAAGMIIESKAFGAVNVEVDENAAGSPHIHLEPSHIASSERQQRLETVPRTLWLTGLSGSGKSTIARNLERELFDRGKAVYHLDGDKLRHGLTRDLGFSREDRCENIRRAAEVAAILNDAGMIVICSFISPYVSDRERARAIIGPDRFLEIFLDTPLEVCESRDPNGLYRKARCGEIQQFTGVSDSYEAPSSPAIALNTNDLSVSECVDAILACVERTIS